MNLEMIISSRMIRKTLAGLPLSSPIKISRFRIRMETCQVCSWSRMDMQPNFQVKKMATETQETRSTRKAKRMWLKNSQRWVSAGKTCKMTTRRKEATVVWRVDRSATISITITMIIQIIISIKDSLNQGRLSTGGAQIPKNMNRNTRAGIKVVMTVGIGEDSVTKGAAVDRTTV